MAEDSLRDLLERLTSVATGAANVHDKPSTIVEEVKDVLDHLARDELPAASAVLLAIDPPGALHHLEVVRALVEAGASVDQAMKNGVTPLIMATQKGHHEVVHALVEAGASVDKRWRNQTPLIMATQKGHHEVVRVLREAGAK